MRSLRCRIRNISINSDGGQDQRQRGEASQQQCVEMGLGNGCRDQFLHRGYVEDPQMPVFDVASMEELVSASISEPHFNALLLGSFAALALILATVGVYGNVSYSAAQRTHEIGIRMALGAQKGDILRIVVGQGIILALLGVAIGIVGALALTRFLVSLLYGVKPTDPLTFTAVSVILTSVAVLASYIPARRAMRVDPMVALRYE